jgi:hypothetical protein
MSNDHSRLKQEIIELIRSMVFLCINCNNQDRITASVIDFENHDSGTHAIAFFICPDCRNKFAVKIQDLVRVIK